MRHKNKGMQTRKHLQGSSDKETQARELKHGNIDKQKQTREHRQKDHKQGNSYN